LFILFSVRAFAWPTAVTVRKSTFYRLSVFFLSFSAVLREISAHGLNALDLDWFVRKFHQNSRLIKSFNFFLSERTNLPGMK